MDMYEILLVFQFVYFVLHAVGYGEEGMRSFNGEQWAFLSGPWDDKPLLITATNTQHINTAAVLDTNMIPFDAKKNPSQFPSYASQDTQERISWWLRKALRSNCYRFYFFAHLALRDRQFSPPVELRQSLILHHLPGLLSFMDDVRASQQAVPGGMSVDLQGWHTANDSGIQQGYDYSGSVEFCAARQDWASVFAQVTKLTWCFRDACRVVCVISEAITVSMA